MSGEPGKARSIRARLTALAIGAVLPVFIFAVALAYVVLDAERDALAEASAWKLRATMSAIDTEVRGHMAALQAVAASDAAQDTDMKRLYANAHRILGSQPTWQNIVIADQAGNCSMPARTAASRRWNTCRST